MKRCPWCGKKINLRRDCLRVWQRRIPSTCIFGRCSNCDNYYAQVIYYYRFFRVAYYLIIPLLILTLITKFVGFIAVYLPIFYLADYFVPIMRVNEKEEYVSPKYDMEFTSFFSGKKPIKKHKMYFLTKDFDNFGAYKTVAPIYIASFDKITNEAKWHFLYEHSENDEYIKKSEFEIFNTDMNSAGQIKITNIKKVGKNYD